MINASLLTKNSGDEHLNAFWQYDGKPRLENNITKALINTFDSLENNEKIDFLCNICNISLPHADYSFELFLQRTPEETIIRSFGDDKRILLALSPTGKCWGTSGIDINDTVAIHENIKKSISEACPEKSEKEIAILTEEEFQKVIGKIDARGNSVPDGWILIKKDDIPQYCVALENKLYDLDPFQLNNHCKKSLYIEENQIVYAKYTDIVECISKYKSFLAEEFIRYLFLLHYIDIDCLEQLSGIDGDLLDFYAKKHRSSILRRLADKSIVNTRKGWLPYIDTDNYICPMAGLDFNKSDKTFVLKLYLASKQTTAVEFYKIIAGGYSIPPKAFVIPSFHFNNGLQNLKGKNSNTYCCNNAKCSINEYLNFWKDNIDSLHKMGPEERHIILEKMRENGIVDEDVFDFTIKYSDSVKTKWSIVPEIGVYYKWTLDEAIKLEKSDGLTTEIREAIQDTFKCFNI